MKTAIFLILGVAAIFLAGAMVLPVAVNLPDSWFGGLLLLLLIVGGAALIAWGVRRKPNAEGKPGTDHN